jgi:hypothetical protein
MSARGGLPPGVPWNLLTETRWTRNGGRRIRTGDVPLPGEVVVTGRGSRSHESMTCSALVYGQDTAKANGFVAGDFFAVSYKLANRFVGPCQVCWSYPSQEDSQEVCTSADNDPSDDQLHPDADIGW